MSDPNDGTKNTPDEPPKDEREPGVPARSGAGEDVDHGELWVPTAPTPGDAESTAPQGPGSSPAVSPPRWSGRKTAIAAALAIGVAGVGAVGASALPLGSGGDSGGFPDGRSGSQFPGGGQAPGLGEGLGGPGSGQAPDGEGLEGQGPWGPHDHDGTDDRALPPRRPGDGDRSDGDGPPGWGHSDGQDGPGDQEGMPDQVEPPTPDDSTSTDDITT